MISSQIQLFSAKGLDDIIWIIAQGFPKSQDPLGTGGT